METIEILNNLEVGTPLIVTTESQGYIIRSVCIYVGKDEDGLYNFFDNSGVTGIFTYSPRYITDHVTVETELKYAADLCTVASLLEIILEKNGKEVK